MIGKITAALVTVLALFGLWASPAHSRQQPAASSELFPVGSGSVSVFRNVPLAGSDAATSAVVVVHGSGRNAAAYFQRMVQAAQNAGVAGSTLVAAPWFATSGDKGAKGSLRWSSGGWKAGDNSTSGGVSSFTVMDELVKRLADRSKFPNLTRIVVAGHSAGGQFTHRYAAVTRIQVDVPLSFVVANPSSYLYPVPERPSNGGFAVPGGGCTGYNKWKYGLEDVPPYVAGMTSGQVASNLATRRITYLLGASDTEQDSELDTDCPAVLEGANRFQRGTLFYSWIRRTFPGAVSDRIVVPDTAHDGAEMFQSPQARAALFGTP